MSRITRPQSLPPCRRGCTGWCGRCCPGNGLARLSCCCGWRIRSYATNGPGAPTKDAAPPAVKAGWSHHPKRVPKRVVVVLGRTQLDRLTPRDVQAMETRLLRHGGVKGSGLSPRTVLHAHRVLCNALEGAVRLGLVSRNVAKSVLPLRVPGKEMRSLTWQELSHLISSVKNPRHRSLYQLAAQTGLRRSELLGLRWGDVDFKNGILSVRRALVRLSSGECEPSAPKSGYGRSLALFPETVELLRELPNSHSGNGDFVYCKPDGSHLDPDVVTRAFGRTARTAGFDGLRFHDLRHTHASLLLKEEVHPKVVSERLGHASIEITLNLYSHVLPTVQRNAVDRFGEAWRAGFSSGPAE